VYAGCLAIYDLTEHETFIPVPIVLPEFLTVRLLLLFAATYLISGPVCCAQYINLLDNQSLHHWMTTAGESVTSGWTFDSDGTLHLQGSGGNIVTRDEYGDFELWFDFRIAEGGNSGIKYRVREYGSSMLGCEYQILDDDAYPDLSRKHNTASLYDIFEPMVSPLAKKSGDQFNTGKVTVSRGRIRHWINGQLTIDECVGTGRWLDHIRESKFSERTGFGQNSCGRIMLTDHRSEVWYRNLYIRRL